MAKPFRKKGQIKNRRTERHKKLFFIGGSLLLFFSFLFTAFLTFVFLTQPPLLSPLPKIAESLGMTTDSTEDELRRLLQGSTVKAKKVSAYSNNTYVVETDENATIVFGKQKDLRVQISSLQLIVSRLTMEGKRFTHLDLRYDKPVVTFR